MERNLTIHQSINMSDLMEQIHPSDDKNIEIRKKVSQLKTYRPKSCKNCHAKFFGSNPKKICNSHSIPRFILRGVGVNLNNINAFVHIPWESSKTGVNSAGTFSLLCTDCDGKLFKEYENPSLYNENFLKECDRQQVMNEIAMKNYLFNMYFHLNEKSKYESMLSKLERDNDTGKGSIVYGIKREEAEIIDAKSSFARTKKYSLSTQDNIYNILYFHVFDYEFSIAFQDKVTIGFDCWGNRINDLEDWEKRTTDFQLIVFPFDGKTFVLAFAEEPNEQLLRMAKSLQKLANQRLAVKALISMAISSSKNFYISPNVSESIFRNNYLRELSGDIGLIKTDCFGNEPVDMPETYASLSQCKLVEQYEKIPDELFDMNR